MSVCHLLECLLVYCFSFAFFLFVCVCTYVCLFVLFLGYRIIKKQTNAKANVKLQKKKLVALKAKGV